MLHGNRFGTQEAMGSVLLPAQVMVVLELDLGLDLVNLRWG